MLCADLSLDEVLRRISDENWSLVPFVDQLELLFELKKRKVNNASSRKVILRTLLTHEKLADELNANKARILGVLQHAWGQKQTSILKSILQKPREEWQEKDERIFNDVLGKYIVSQRDQRKMTNVLLKLFS